MKIKKVKIENFRNIIIDEFYPTDTHIFTGANGSGKTNRLEAIYWALTDSTINGTKKSMDMELKPFSAGDDEIETSVTVEFDDGTTIAKSLLHSQNGSTRRMFTINNKFEQSTKALDFINEYLGVKDLGDKLNSLGIKNTNAMQMLYDVQIWKKIDNIDLRVLLMAMASDVDFNEIASAKTVEIVANKNYDDVISNLKQNVDKLIIDIKNKDQQIEELKKQASGFNKNEIDEAQQEIDKIDAEIDKIKIKINDKQNNFNNNLDAKIKELEISAQNEKNAQTLITIDKLEKLKQPLEKELNDLIDKNNALNNKIYELKNKLSNAINNHNSNITNLKNKIKYNEQERDSLLSEHKLYTNLLESEKSKNADGFKCEACGHVHIDENKKATILANIKKYETKIADIIENGSKLKQTIETDKSELDQIKLSNVGIDLENEINDLTKQLNYDKVEIINKQIYEISSNYNGMANDTKYNQILAEISDLKNNRDNLLQVNQNEINNLKNDIVELNRVKQPFNQIMTKLVIHNNLLERLDIERNKLQTIKTNLDNAKLTLRNVRNDIVNYYDKVRESIKKVLGDNFDVELYTLTIDGDFNTRKTRLLYKDVDNRMINAKTINTAHYIMRSIELVSNIKKYFNINESFIFVDEIQVVDSDNIKLIENMPEQVFGTRNN